MKSKTYNILEKLNKNNKIQSLNKAESYFLLINNGKAARIDIEINGDQIINNVTHTNYNNKYVKHKVKKLFTDEGLSAKTRVQSLYNYKSGDVLRLQKYLTGIDKGKIKELKSYDNYFSINNQQINCYKTNLGENVLAKYLGNDINRCINGNVDTNYSLFEVI